MVDDDSLLKSDADDQLLLFIPFVEQVRIHSINFIGSNEIDEQPRKMKFFVNKSEIDFDSAEFLKPTQAVALSEKDLDRDSVTELKYVLFQRVNVLTIFIESSVGGDITSLKHLKIYG